MPQRVDQGAKIGRRSFVRKDTLVLATLMIIVGAAIIYFAADYERKSAKASAKAECAMPDGTILVLEKVTFGTHHGFQGPERGIARLFGGNPRYGETATTASDAYMIWLSRRDPSTGRALDFDWWFRSVAVDDHGCEIQDEQPVRQTYSSRGSSSQSGGRPFGPVTSDSSVPYDNILVRSSIPTFRHSGSTIKLRVYNTEPAIVAEFEVPDPSPKRQFPVWEPEPLPISKSDGDLDVKLIKIVGTRHEAGTVNGQKQWRTRCQPELRVTQRGERADHWGRRSVRFFDATGNSASEWDCNLCTREEAWRMQLRLFRGENAEFDASEIWSVADIPVATRGASNQSRQSETLQGVTVELIAIGGGGTVTHSGSVPIGSGSFSSSGSVSSGQTNWAYEIKHESSLGTTTVTSELPHIMARVSGITEDHYFPDLFVADDQSRPVKAHHQSSWASDRPTCWFLEIPPGAQSLDLKFVVQKGRTFEFYFEPPQIEPIELFQAADELARTGQWPEAAAEFTKALDAYPHNHWHWYRSICLQAQVEDRDRYQRQCHRMLELFGDTDDPFIAERTTKVCLLWPELVAETERLSELADRAVTQQPNNPWFLLARGVVEYRRRRFDPAVEWLKKALEAPGNSIYSTSLTHLFLTMSHHRLGRRDAARESLEAAVRIMDQQFPKSDVADLGSPWHDWLICQIVRREAEKLIGTP